MAGNTITCPNCGHKFAADEAMQHQAEEKFKAQFDAQLARQQAEHEQQLKDQLEQAKAKFKSEAEKTIQEEYEEKLKSLQEENEKRKTENKELKKRELELLQKESDLKEKEEELRLQMQKELLEKREAIAEEIRKKEQEKNELLIREKDKKLQDQEKLITEMDRKIKQGSMQMQGETLELALEDFLKREYPYDIISEVPKGVKGADVIQTVKNELNQECGKIIYESKRTKSFGGDWIEKLKADQRDQQADLAVIVTETLPKDMDRFGSRDNVWICTFAEAKSLTFVLREMLIKTHAAAGAEENKTDKMSMLYRYLTSTEFAQRIEAIVEGFTDMKTGIDTEKRAMQKIWKEREKQIEKVTANTIDMYGAIKGIAGKAIGTVKALELPAGEV